MLTKSKWLYLFGALSMSISAHAFDLEDYATTYRATRDAYLKAANETKLATGPYKAAKNAYISASLNYAQANGDNDEVARLLGIQSKNNACVGQ